MNIELSILRYVHSPNAIKRAVFFSRQKNIIWNQQFIEIWFDTVTVCSDNGKH